MARLLADWRHAGHDAAVLAFAYDKAGPVVWPAPPPGLVALGRRDAAPYGIAAWATPGLAEDVWPTLVAQGWAAA